MEPREISPDQKEEQLLLRQLKRGDIDSYEIIFHRYYPTYFHFAKGMLKDIKAAEDIVQNVFMKIWQNRESLEEDKSIKNYIYVLSKREILNYFRAKYNTQILLTEEIQAFDMPDESKAFGLDYEELKGSVQQVMDQMPPRRRSIYYMSRFESLSNREIAQQLGISIRTVEKHIELAIRTFREQLGEFFFLILLICVDLFS